MSDLSFEHVISHQYTIFDGLGGMHVEDIYQAFAQIDTGGK